MFTVIGLANIRGNSRFAFFCFKTGVLGDNLW